MNGLLRRIRAAFEGLSPRERALVLVAGVLVVMGLAYALVVRPIAGAGEQAELRLATAEQELQAMRRLRREYDDVSQRLATVEKRIKSGSRGNLRTTLETLAREATVKVESMEPQASPSNDAYRETKVEVGLKNVTLSQTVNYLHQIETAAQALSVKSLRIRTRPDKPELLDVTFTVSSFEPL